MTARHEWDWPPERTRIAELSFRFPARRKSGRGRFADGFFRVIKTCLKVAAGIILVSVMAGAIWIMVTAIKAWT
ncbi:hypothetical protein SAMN05444161_8850 [Rhizobiales bacterium GAS191]|nr:hypothetical protein SAMN05444161_8850 [Rhizobiales bacterium GAS191]